VSFVLRTTAIVTLMAMAPLAQGQEGSTPVVQPDPSLNKAKELFRQGVVLFQSGQVEEALKLFMQSRAHVSSSRNTINAALCLEQLGRFDEALELFEEALRFHRAELDEGDRDGVDAAIRRLSRRVGSLNVSANVRGSVVVDGRLRGELPLRGVLRLSPGKHVVRVLSDGFATYETGVEVHAGETISVDAQLQRLTRSGGLRVEVAGGVPARVVVDGAELGSAPWEGTLAPGPHVVQAYGDAVGSLPVRVVVVEGQTVLVRTQPRPIGPRYVLEVDPGEAVLSIGGVEVGEGRWEGFLPSGLVEVTARGEGYLSARIDLEVPSEGGTKTQLIRLQPDTNHPRWPRPPALHPWVGAYVGWALGPRLTSDPEHVCPEMCSDSPPVMGVLVGARAGLELKVPLSLEVSVGYLSLGRAIDRHVETSFYRAGTAYPITYALKETIRLRGPMVAAGGSYRVPLHGGFSWIGRTAVGAWFGQSTDTISGSAGHDRLSIAGAGEPVSSTLLVVMPEVAIGWGRDSWMLHAGVSALFTPNRGPTLPHGEMGASPQTCTPANPGAPACAPHSTAIQGERAYGPFWVLLPQLSATRRF
jgi:hypothetical protein